MSKTVKIRNAGAGKYLNIHGSNVTSLTPHQNVTIWADSGSNEQKWQVDGATWFSYTGPIRSVVNLSYGLNVYRSGNPYNCDVYPVSGNETDSDIVLTSVIGATSEKIKLKNYNLYLTAASTANGANVYWAAESDSNLQKWYFETVVDDEDDDDTGSGSSTLLRCPLDSYIQIEQGYSSSHPAIDYSANRYTPIKAAKDGRVIYMQNWTGGTSDYASMGHTVYVQHDDGMTIYMHMNEYPSDYVTLGQNVKKGDVIGRVGTTGLSDGYHLHFAYKRGTSFSYNNVNAYNEGTWANPQNYME